MIIFDTENGRDPKAVDQFIGALAATAGMSPGHDVTITVGDIQLKAYDHAALIQGIIDAVKYYQEEIS